MGDAYLTTGFSAIEAELAACSDARLTADFLAIEEECTADFGPS